MKKLLLVLLLSGKVQAMEPTANDIASKIATIIEMYSEENKQEDAQFKQLVVAYFEKESQELEDRVMPHLKSRIQDSSASIDRILETDDKEALQALVNRLITDSLEDAFKEDTNRFEELKALADNKLRKTQYALIATIITSVLSIGGTIAGLWFGR